MAAEIKRINEQALSEILKSKSKLGQPSLIDFVRYVVSIYYADVGITRSLKKTTEEL